MCWLVSREAEAACFAVGVGCINLAAAATEHIVTPSLREDGLAQDETGVTVRRVDVGELDRCAHHWHAVAWSIGRPLIGCQSGLADFGLQIQQLIISRWLKQSSAHISAEGRRS